MDRAGSALRLAAAEFGIVQFELRVERVEQGHCRIDVDGLGLAVDDEADFLVHGDSSFWHNLLRKTLGPDDGCVKRFLGSGEGAAIMLRDMAQNQKLVVAILLAAGSGSRFG